MDVDPVGFEVERGGWCAEEGYLTFIVSFLCTLQAVSCSSYNNPVREVLLYLHITDGETKA